MNYNVRNVKAKVNELNNALYELDYTANPDDYLCTYDVRIDVVPAIQAAIDIIEMNTKYYEKKDYEKCLEECKEARKTRRGAVEGE